MLQGSSHDLVWKALADPVRRRILDLLREKPRTTGFLCEQFADRLARTAVMRHMDVLEQANLLIIRRDGRVRWNLINPVPIQRVCDRWVQRHVRSLASSLSRLKDFAERT